MNVTTVGLDLAKNIFHIVGLNEQGKEKTKKRLSRGQVLKYFANTPSCLIGMEACAGAHHFARELTKLGHEIVGSGLAKLQARGRAGDSTRIRRRRVRVAVAGPPR
ncbi:MAG: hypothetical protein M1283_02215 [Gammaproteobacteria bacterium]|nr:hypothetical protein [Gammaproteobacteria bacterium]